MRKLILACCQRWIKLFNNLAKISNCVMVKSEESGVLQWDGQTIKTVKVEVSGLYLSILTSYKELDIWDFVFNIFILFQFANIWDHVTIFIISAIY